MKCHFVIVLNEQIDQLVVVNNLTMVVQLGQDIYGIYFQILKPNTSAHPNPSSWVFKQFSRRLSSWQSMILLLLLDKIAPINWIKNCVIIS